MIYANYLSKNNKYLMKYALWICVVDIKKQIKANIFVNRQANRFAILFGLCVVFVYLL